MTIIELLTRYNNGIYDGSHTKLSKKIGINRLTVGRWTKPYSQGPEEALRPKVAKELGVTVEQLMSCFPARASSSPSAESAASASFSPLQYVPLEYVPVVGVVSAETFNCVFEDNNTPLEVLPMPVLPGTKAQALKVRGHCMEPTASDGDYIIVAAKAAYEDGSLIVAKVDGECTLKRMQTRGDKVILVPDNKEYKRKEVKKEDLQIVGVVVFILRRPAPKKI